MKTIHYTATAVKTYREAIDRYYADPGKFEPTPYWQTELNKITGRNYCTGFYFDEIEQTEPQYKAPRPSDYALMAKVLGSKGTKLAAIEVRNQIRVKDHIEIVKPKGPPITDTITNIYDAEGVPLSLAQPGSKVTVRLNTDCEYLDLFRGIKTPGQN